MSDPTEILGVANELANGLTQAHWRSAASRAYYASFHALKAWHASLPMPGRVGSANGEHEQLIQQLASPDKLCSPEQAKLSRWFAGQLDLLRAMRILGDYRLGDSITQAQAMTACSIAKSIIDRT